MQSPLGALESSMGIDPTNMWAPTPMSDRFDGSIDDDDDSTPVGRSAVHYGGGALFEDSPMADSPMADAPMAETPTAA
eukprot:7176354-Prymnesium_polylepis.1